MSISHSCVIVFNCILAYLTLLRLCCQVEYVFCFLSLLDLNIPLCVLRLWEWKCKTKKETTADTCLSLVHIPVNNILVGGA